jgi:hypothetical protein
MSALGQGGHISWVGPMSALPPKADLQPVSRDVRYVPEGEVMTSSLQPRFSRDAAGRFAFRQKRTLASRLKFASLRESCLPTLMTAGRRDKPHAVLCSEWLRAP